MTAASAELLNTHAKINKAPAVDPVEIFELRCWARAVLFFNGEFDMAEAVDALQQAAERDGLIDNIGQDAVQRIIAGAFGETR